MAKDDDYVPRHPGKYKKAQEAPKKSSGNGKGTKGGGGKGGGNAWTAYLGK